MMSNLDKLVYMANQIARNFDARHQEAAIAATADHIGHYWDPRMRAQIFEHIEKGGADLSEVAKAALLRLKETAAV